MSSCPGGLNNGVPDGGPPDGLPGPPGPVGLATVAESLIVPREEDRTTVTGCPRSAIARPAAAPVSRRVRQVPRLTTAALAPRTRDSLNVARPALTDTAVGRCLAVSRRELVRPTTILVPDVV